MWVPAPCVPTCGGTIEDPRIQAVVIATHHDSHPDYAVMAANAGKHILIEKPLALTVAEARRIVEAVAANDVQLMVGFQARFAPLVTRAKAFIPQSLVSTGQMIDPRWSESSWAQSPDRGGANVISQGVHTFDLLSYFPRRGAGRHRCRWRGVHSPGFRAD